jgi:hypothetical protein
MQIATALLPANADAHSSASAQISGDIACVEPKVEVPKRW